MKTHIYHRSLIRVHEAWTIPPPSCHLIERWWTAKEIPAARPYLMELVQRDFRFGDFDNQVFEAVLQLAARGQVEIGEKNGGILTRSPNRVHHPAFRTWTLLLLECTWKPRQEIHRTVQGQGRQEWGRFDWRGGMGFMSTYSTWPAFTVKRWPYPLSNGRPSW